MGLRNWLKKLERGADDELTSFELVDGSRYYYAPGPALFLYCYDTVGKNPSDWPEPPEVLLKMCEARDPAVAFEMVMGGNPSGATDFIYSDIFPYDPEIIINERRLEPRSLVAGRDPYDRELDDLAE